MTAASVWSLIIPSIEYCADMGRLSFLPALTGFVLGMLLLSVLDRVFEKLKEKNSTEKKADMSFIAITIHNFPEGMAVGMMYAACIAGKADATPVAAFTLAMAIALQNIPEGAIISLPMHARGFKKSESFLYGVLSGIVEPLGAVLTIAWVNFAQGLLPYLFGFAAGAMLFVVADELIAKRKSEKELPLSALCFGAGFCVMMVMDVALG